MLAVHELGHVVGAVVTGGRIERVVLHPFTISRTDVTPNPHPGIVVWLGPVIGSLLPLAIFVAVPRQLGDLSGITQFFAGFCLVANGAYIGLGAFSQAGDCGEMLRTGTPLWVMFAFGIVAVTLGLYLWHELGSLTQFLKTPALISSRTAWLVFGTTLAMLVVVVALSPE